MTAREFAEAVGDAVFRRMGRAASRFQEETPLPVDLLESEDEYLAVFDAPGVVASDVQVNYDDGAVEVRIDRFREFREGVEMVFPGRGLSLDGRARLPEDAAVDASSARAELRDEGTLYVFLPKVDDQGEDVPVESAARRSGGDGGGRDAAESDARGGTPARSTSATKPARTRPEVGSRLKPRPPDRTAQERRDL
ncbi:Hsp20/alpha crystallin family protein [Halobacterium bonnevillei]|uniref:Hsp20 family protein n=1 Tax=Halobacterium bonnevillei TaxID=2692200 RepID=A0A6B0SYY4_9EURY|nr:Hsp20/alpha crystallin family protein [Halobacterium bonnevillei]MXR22539.1 Hsp20 family protein [Halobacterium bonnevillei]